MRKTIVFLNVVLAFLGIFPLYAAKGQVVAEKGDYYIIDTGSSYTLMEWYGGGVLYQGNNIVGDLNSYGFKEIYNTTRGCETRVYIENYLLDEEDAIEQLYEISS